jgi:hypothetical protein
MEVSSEGFGSAARNDAVERRKVGEQDAGQRHGDESVGRPGGDVQPGTQTDPMPATVQAKAGSATSMTIDMNAR